MNHQCPPLSPAAVAQQRDATFFARMHPHLTPDEAERYAWLADSPMHSRIVESLEEYGAGPAMQEDANARIEGEAERIAALELTIADLEDALDDVREEKRALEEEANGLRTRLDHQGAGA